MDVKHTSVLIVAVLMSIQVCVNELLRCESDRDCPMDGFCFKDECSRCLCPSGHEVVNFYNGGSLSKICRTKPQVRVRIGDRCSAEVGRVTCPFGSACASNGSCACAPGLVANADGTNCRRPRFGEACGADSPCEDVLGFHCQTNSHRCACRHDHHQPTRWTRFVLNRWNYSRVEGGLQQCVVRAVGEACLTDAECGAVQGSGAVCSPCGYCQCQLHRHVPDILGTKCGRGLGYNAACVLHGRRVCDGSRGLQCGDVCDLYFYDFRRKYNCRCSQMHDRINDQCSAKTVGSTCSTDLDCYLINEGFGFCQNGKCSVQVPAKGEGYNAHFVNRKCVDKDISGSTPPGGQRPNQPNLPGLEQNTSYLHGSVSGQMYTTGVKGTGYIRFDQHHSNNSSRTTSPLAISHSTNGQTMINTSVYLYIVWHFCLSCI